MVPLTSLREPLEALQSWQRRLLLIAFLLIVATRWYALAPTMWDWDEAQFASGVREFNAGGHHPHPPGFPLYMAAAKMVRPFVANDFRAAQTIIFLCACALFPLAFSLARELRFSFTTSFLAALLFVFFPNVWFYGGTAFSDIAGTATAIAAAWLLFRGCRDPRAYLAGAVMLGIAAGIRSQALLFGFVPLAVASWFQVRASWRRVVAAAVLLAAIVGGSYIGAALASDSIEGYQKSLEGVREWVRTIDSFLAPHREPLETIADDYLLHPMPGGRLPLIVSALAIIGLIGAMFRRNLGAWLAFGTFMPFAIFAWLMLDLNSVYRYSTSYVFLWALLAAYGAELLATPLRRWQWAAQVAIIVLLAGRAAYWTIPALRDVRNSESPTYAAMQWVRSRVPPGGAVWVHGSLAPFAEYDLRDRNVHLARDLHALPRTAVPWNAFFVSEGVLTEAEVTFRRERTRLFEIARRRYFETSVVRVASVWTFDEGWYGTETDGATTWQWMGRRARVFLPAIPGAAILRMTLNAPGGYESDAEIVFNGQTVARVRCTGEPFEGEWRVTSRTDAPNELVILSSDVVNLKAKGIAEDPRDLGLLLSAYSWQAVSH
jgi:hypothetical protein